MKLSVILLSLLVVLPAISAMQINMNANYSLGETLIASISGNFINPIQQQNVLLYNGHIRVSFIPVIEKINDSFYIYGQLSGRSEGNYSLVISGISYFQGTQVSNDDITQNFTITNNTADFTVDPGFVDSSGNFSISVQNLAGNAIIITYWIQNLTSSGNSFLTSLLENNAPAGSQTISLQSGQVKSIPFQVNSSSEQQQLSAILETGNTSYEIPVFIEPSQGQISQNGSATPASGIEIQPSNANVSLSTNSTTSRYIYVYNLDNRSSTNVSLYVSPSISQYVSVPNETFEIPENSSMKVMINLTSGATGGIFYGQINAISNYSNYSMGLLLNFSDNYLPTSDTSSLFQTCTQLNGNLCNENQTCTGQTTNAQDGVCCLATCQPISNNQAGKIIGWTIVAIVVIFLLIFLIMRYRKASRPFNLLDFMKKKR